MTALTLPLKAEYFDAIRDGSKLEEYRLVTPFWAKRLEGRTYDRRRADEGLPPAYGFRPAPRTSVARLHPQDYHASSLRSRARRGLCHRRFGPPRLMF